MRVAMTGCFDCFHAGHEHILEKAFKLVHDESNHLGLDNEISVIILINTDSSIKELKGDDRPFNPLEVRVRNVLQYCEELKQKYQTRYIVLPFISEEMLLDMYHIWEPDMILHGNDINYTADITGILEYPVLLVPRLKDSNSEDISTTAILRKENDNRI